MHDYFNWETHEREIISKDTGKFITVLDIFDMSSVFL